jgi:hypothetical protein
MSDKSRRARWEAQYGRRAGAHGIEGDMNPGPEPPPRGSMSRAVHQPRAQAVVKKKKVKKEKKKTRKEKRAGQIGGLKEQQQRRRAKKKGNW